MNGVNPVESTEDDSSYDGDEGVGQRTQQEKKPWDVFKNPPQRNSSGSVSDKRALETVTKIVKVLAVIFTTVVVLGSAVLVKGTVIFMTSQLRKGKQTVYCNKALGGEKQFTAELPEEERVAWMWCILIAYAVPELGTFIRASRMCFFKTIAKPSLPEFLIAFFMETFHTIGMALLFFVILPNLDVLKGVMLTNCLCFIPGVLAIASRNMNEPGRSVKLVADVAATAIQATGFVVWPMLEGSEKPQLWLIPITTIFISCGWWENYISATENAPLGFVKPLQQIMKRLAATRYYNYLFISCWKILCFFVSILVILALQNENVNNFFSLLPAAFGPHKIKVTEVISSDAGTSVLDEALTTREQFEMDAYYYASVFVLVIQMCAAYLCYIFGKFACKIMIQPIAFAFPINVTVPLSISLLIVMCGLKNSDPCTYRNVIPDYLFFDAPSSYTVADFLGTQHAWIWLLWLFSQTWITFHLWSPQCKRLSPTDRLFVTPLYNSLLIDQSLAFNRRRDDTNMEVIEPDMFPDDELDDIYIAEKEMLEPSDEITRIYACATMWHETRDEMLEMLKSVFRMDIDQSARRLARKYFSVNDPDYYEFETHILFDDAFETNSEGDRVVNSYVKLLVSVIDEAATLVHGTTIKLRPPVKYPTPYGGRLVWTLPGKTKINCHLKDGDKIRTRKRWSQVMYMYYLLGHRLMERPIAVHRKEAIARNTYLLAMDGDIDFQPEAVLLLVDLMKKDPNLGAACGRIHPIGSGPMQWYQVFEYAIGHWLQKATEHVIGCVLCSPGAFSLFRARALMDDSVMNKYAFRSCEARHYVQFDQGEDRWLCTLLLQRGYRVEYAAASDSYTHCPEGFNEFFNQRRRWIPSTTANILDLLMDSKRTIKANDNISLPYILYQFLLMGGTILGPGTIFLMLTGACVTAFRIDNWTSFLYNVTPILIFMLVCYTCRSDIQLTVAMIITVVYSLVMMAVLVGLILQIQEDGILAPSSLFLVLCIAEFIIAAIFHPKEMYCLPPIVIYYITIPSMYLLLIIYSVFNLNNISWGTRESPKVQTQQEQPAAAEMKKKDKKTGMFSFFTNFAEKTKTNKGSFEFSLANLFKCMCCTYPKPSEEAELLIRITANLDTLGKRLDSIERILDPNSHLTGRLRVRPNLRENPLTPYPEHPEFDQESKKNSDDNESVISETKEDRIDDVNPLWIEDRKLKKGEIDYLSKTEKEFWKDLIAGYLFPLFEDHEENKAEKARITKDLKALRDTSVFAFFMINALFVLVVFLLQQNKETIYIQWPLGAKANITFVEDNNEARVTKEYLELEPIGLVFALFFGIVLIVQFIAMMFHRLGTLSHVLASTKVNLFSCGKDEDQKDEETIRKDILTIVSNLQQMPPEVDEAQEKRKPSRRRPTWAQGTSQTPKKLTLSSILKDQMQQLMNEGDRGVERASRYSRVSRSAVSHLIERHRNTMVERRNSKAMAGQTKTSTISSPWTSPTYTENTIDGHVNAGFDGLSEDTGMSRRPSQKRKITVTFASTDDK